MDLPKRGFIFAISQHSIRWLGTQRARSTDNRGWKNGVERVGDAYRRGSDRAPARPASHVCKTWTRGREFEYDYGNDCEQGERADPFLLRGYWAAVGNRRRLVVVIVIILINLAVFRVYRIATSKLFLKPAANRLEHSSGPINDALTEMHNGSTIPIRSFSNRSSGLLRR